MWSSPWVSESEFQVFHETNAFLLKTSAAMKPIAPEEESTWCYPGLKLSRINLVVSSKEKTKGLSGVLASGSF